MPTTLQRSLLPNATTTNPHTVSSSPIPQSSNDTTINPQQYISTYPQRPVLGHDPIREAGAKASVLHDAPAYKARMRELLWPMVPSSFISTTADGQPNPDFRPRHQRVSPSRANELITLSKRLQLEEMSIAPPQHEPPPGALSKRLVQLHGYASLGEDSSADARHLAQARQRRQSERMYLDADPRRRLEGNGSGVSQVISGGVQQHHSTPTLEALNPITNTSPPHVTIKDATSSPASPKQQHPTHSSQHGKKRTVGDITAGHTTTSTTTDDGSSPSSKFAFVSKGYRQGLEERAAVGLVPSFIGNHNNTLHHGSGSMRMSQQGDSSFMSGSHIGGVGGSLSRLGESMSVMDEVRIRHARFVRRPLADTVVDQERDAELLQMMQQVGLDQHTSHSINNNMKSSTRGSLAFSSSQLAKMRNTHQKKKRSNKDHGDADEVIIALTSSTQKSTTTANNSTTTATSNNINTLSHHANNSKEEQEADAAAVFAMASGKQRLLFRPYRDIVLSHDDAVGYRDAAMDDDDDDEIGTTSSSDDDTTDNEGGDHRHDDGDDPLGAADPVVDIHPSPSELAGYLYHALMYDPRLPQGGNNNNTVPTFGNDTSGSARLPPSIQSISPFQHHHSPPPLSTVLSNEDMKSIGSMLIPSQAPGDVVNGGGGGGGVSIPSSSSRPPPGASPRGAYIMGAGPSSSGQPPQLPKLPTTDNGPMGDSTLGGSPLATPSTMDALASSLRRADSQARLRSSSSMHGANAIRRLMSVRAGSRTSFGVGGTAEQLAQAAAAKAQKAQWEEASIKLIEQQQLRELGGELQSANNHSGHRAESEIDVRVMDTSDTSHQTNTNTKQSKGEFTAFKSDDEDSCGSNEEMYHQVVENAVEDAFDDYVRVPDVLESTIIREEGTTTPSRNGGDVDGEEDPCGELYDSPRGIEHHGTAVFDPEDGADEHGNPITTTAKKQRAKKPSTKKVKRYVLTAPGMENPPIYFSYHTPSPSYVSYLQLTPSPTDIVTPPTSTSKSTDTTTNKVVFYTIPMTIEDCVVGGIIVEYQPHKAWNGEDVSGGGAKILPPDHYSAHVRGASTAAHLHGIPRVDEGDDDVDNNVDSNHHSHNRLTASRSTAPKVPTWYKSFSEAMRALDSLHRVRGAEDSAVKRNSSNRSRPPSSQGPTQHKKQKMKRKSKRRKSSRRRRTTSRGGDSSSRGSVSFGDSQGSLSMSDGGSNMATSDDDDDEIKNMNVNTVYDLPKMVRCSPQRTTSKRGEVSTRSVIPAPSRIELHMQQTSNALAKMLKSRDVALELNRANRVIASNSLMSPLKRSQLPPTPSTTPSHQQRPSTPLQQQHQSPSSGKRRKGSPTRERMLTGTHNTYMQQLVTDPPSTPVGVSMLGSGSRPPSSTESRLGAVIHRPMTRDNHNTSKATNTNQRSVSSPVPTPSISTKQATQPFNGVSPSFSGAFGAARRTAESKFQGHRRDWKYRPTNKK